MRVIALLSLVACGSSAGPSPPTGPVQGQVPGNAHFMLTFANAYWDMPGGARFLTLRFTDFQGSCMNGINWPQGTSGVELEVVIPQDKVQVASYAIDKSSPRGGTAPTAEILFGAFQQMSDVALSGTLDLQEASPTQVSGWLSLSNGASQVAGTFSIPLCP